jgi:hypothetical protein
MAYNVQFLKGTAANYAALTSKDPNTFYYVDSDLYLGEIKLSNAADLNAALTRLGVAETNIDNLESAVGTLDSLSTTAKSDLVTAINEIYSMAGDAASAGTVTLTTADTPTEGYLKTYVLSQYTKEIGKIDIPKDLVVESGTVVTDPEGQDKGTYIKLVIANQTDPIYINVKDLVDIYTAAKNATQIQLAVNVNNEISATIVAGSVGTTELADNAVTTAKIADANVTLAKLSSSLQASIGKADSAIQQIATGSTNGTIAVDGTDVAVKGLGSAAYKADTAFDVAGAASAVLGAVSDSSTANTVYGAKAYADSLGSNYDAKGTAADKIKELDATVSQTASADNGQIAISVVETDGKLTSVTASIASNTYDASGSAATALTNAKLYTDTALTWTTF